MPLDTCLIVELCCCGFADGVRCTNCVCDVASVDVLGGKPFSTTDVWPPMASLRNNKFMYFL